eukprot:CAMPEP_0117571022 /NCGR_PEP_ID=MMETSP0784-20121206/59517_1 /TAXON_ID=39447 /ORGANISM="" /LENGTH=148 /DNA_ID=CAMNT_0005369129 /DNA_START=214 /DNA_END=658 /DNA_ORIENTATION=-
MGWVLLQLLHGAAPKQEEASEHNDHENGNENYCAEAAAGGRNQSIGLPQGGPRANVQSLEDLDVPTSGVALSASNAATAGWKFTLAPTFDPEPEPSATLNKMGRAMTSASDVVTLHCFGIFIAMCPTSSVARLRSQLYAEMGTLHWLE